MSDTARSFRFPKWLADENYIIEYNKEKPHRFSVTLFSRKGWNFVHGYGGTIAVAAKRALQRRTDLLGAKK